MIFMKIRCLFFSFLLFSNTFFGMQLVRQDKVFKRLNQKISMNKFFHCKCIESLKKEIGEECDADSDTIEKARTIVGSSFALVSDKDQLLKEGKWPKLEGAALENELRLNRYCPNFVYCANRYITEHNFHHNIKKLSIPAFIVTVGPSLLGTIFMHFNDSNPVAIFCTYCVPLAPIAAAACLYSSVALHRILKNEEMLTYIARKHLYYLEPKYNNFKCAQQNLFDELWQKELQEKNKE